MNFRSLGLVSPILKVLDKQGLHIPTPIQEKSIPFILEGKDVIGLAQTGTGKTAAFILPLLSRLYGTQQTGKFRKIKILVLSPTRELAQQIGEVVKPFASATNLKTCTIVGGVPILKQFKELRKGSDIIIGTPGRIEDHISKKSIDLCNVNFVVLDEADQMLDIGFLPAIKRILRFTPKNRQTLLFSATMPNKIQTFAKSALVRPVIVNVGRAGAANLDVIQEVEYVKQEAKVMYLLECLQKTSPPVLIFVESMQEADDDCQ